MEMAMPVERRFYERVRPAQFYLRIMGQVYRTLEWSYGGFLVEDATGRLAAGALLSIDGLISEADYRAAQSPHRVNIRARVLRTDPDRKTAALSALNIDDTAYRILRTLDGSMPAEGPSE